MVQCTLVKACCGEAVEVKTSGMTVENFVILLLQKQVSIWPQVGCEAPPGSVVYVHGFPRESCEVEKDWRVLWTSYQLGLAWSQFLAGTDFDVQ